MVNQRASRAKEFYWTVTRFIGLGFTHEWTAGQLKDAVCTMLVNAMYWLLTPVTAVVADLLRRLHIEFLDLPCWQLNRIGHAALDIDCYLKETMLAGVTVRPILLAAGCAPNASLIEHWAEFMPVVRSRMCRLLLQPVMRKAGLSTKLTEYILVGWPTGSTFPTIEGRRGASRLYDVQRQWGARAPLLSLTAGKIGQGRAVLRRLGLPDDAWFVCVHSREGGYWSREEAYHSHRNSDFMDFKLAMDEIVARGGWCIRMGDPSMRTLPDIPGVVDYAHCEQKSDAMDVFLCARCRFFLGTNSGLFLLAGVFGRPTALSNLTPLTCSYSPFGNGIFIPKLIRGEQGRVLTFSECFRTEACDLRYAQEFAERGLMTIDNDPQDIKELAIEVMNVLDGTVHYTSDDDELQSAFRRLIEPHHYCYGAFSRVGRSFLATHRHLL